MYTVYALYNQSSYKIYIGQTNDLKRRLIEHNQKRGRHYTAQYRGTWVLIYKESVATRSEVLTREKQLKSGNGRAFIKQFIPK